MSEPPDEALNSLLDTFAPGLSWLVRLISAALGVNVLSSVLPLVALPIISTFLLPSLSRALEPIISFFVASAEIKHRNNLYPQVTRWMSEVESYSCSGSAIAGITEAFGYLWDSNDKSPEYVDTEIPAHQGKIERIRITPGQGHYHFFQYQDCLFAFYRDPHRNVLDHFSRNGENLYFYYMFWNRAVFENLLEDIQKVNVDLRRGKLPVYSAYQVKGDASWRKMSDEIPRSPDSLALDEGLKKEMFEDIENFLSKAVVQLYQKRGIPYRRGYLLYGPPGTGKTSWCRVIATSFGFALYVIDPATVDDHGLRELFRTLPERCLVVLEDIDCAGIDQRGNTTNEKKDGSRQKGVTLATVLNVLDGIGAHAGHLMIATTNAKIALDPALTRPGRIDKQYEFRNPDAPTIHAYFNSFFGTCNADAKSSNPTLDQLASQFSAMVSGLALSPAAIQEYFLQCNEDPKVAVENVATLESTTR